jgi:hypothetical protein
LVDAKLYTVLSTTAGVTALVGNRIYPDKLPQTPVYPAVVYQGIAGARENHLRGYASLENPLMQIDAWATTKAGAATLTAAIITAVCAATTFAAIVPNVPQYIWDDEVEKYRCIIEFSIWNRS